MNIFLILLFLIHFCFAQAEEILVGYLLVTFTNDDYAVVPVGAEVHDGKTLKEFEFELNGNPDLKSKKVYQFAYVPVRDTNTKDVDIQLFTTSTIEPTLLWPFSSPVVKSVKFMGQGPRYKERLEWIENLKKGKMWDDVVWIGWAKSGWVRKEIAHELSKVKIMNIHATDRSEYAVWPGPEAE